MEKIPEFTEDLNIISRLSDSPNTGDMLDAQELKSKFDEAGLAIQKFLNEVLVPAINNWKPGDNSGADSEILVYGVADDGQIYKAVMTGRMVYCLYNDLYYLPLMSWDEGSHTAVFGGCYGTEIITCTAEAGEWSAKITDVSTSEPEVFVGTENTTVAEFNEAFASGKPCFLMKATAGSGITMWVLYSCSSSVAYFYRITPDGSVQYGSLESSGTFTYETAANSSSGESNVFIGDADTTVAEYYAAFASDKACFMIRPWAGTGNTMWTAYTCNQSNTQFYRITGNGDIQYGMLNSDGTFNYTTLGRTTTIDEKSTDEQIPTAKAVYDFGLGVSGGLSDSAKNLLITILRNAVYSTDQSANIAALENALAGGEEEPDEPDVPDVPVVTTYTISKELVNVTSNNAATSVNENASYTATLTADEGYEISKVTVTMGGVDVTADVYADGVISIPSVTGNVEIIASAVVIEEPSAELVTEGLLAYFDFRTAEYNNSGTGGSTTISPTKGEGQLFTWANNVVTGQDNRGMHTISGRPFMYSQAGNAVQTDIGTPMTIVMLTHGHVMVHGFNNLNLTPNWAFRPEYKTSADTMAFAEQREGSLYNADSKSDYNFCVYRVDGDILTEIMDTSVTTYDGSEIDRFASWKTTVGVDVFRGSDDVKYMVALAVYNRALSDVEIEEVRAFMKTLEVA